MKQSVAIIDFGTSKVTALIGRRGSNGTVNIDGIGICDYAGYVNGEWLDPENLNDTVHRALSAAETSARVKVAKLYVGVPGDFLRCEVNDVSMSMGRRRRVTDTDVSDLHAQGNIYFNDGEYTVINIQPIYYTLDDDRKLIAPVGLSSTRLGGSISYMLAHNEFIRTIDAAVYAAGVQETEYVAAPLAETLLLFDDYKRDNCVILADVGALTTTLVVGRGDGLCRKYNFPWGGECITDALSEELCITRDEAERLKRKVILSLDTDYVPPSDEPGLIKTEYLVESKTDSRTYPVDTTNSIVRSEIGRFAKYVDKTLSICDYEYPEFTPLSVTGAGFVTLRGATEILSRLIHREVEAVKPAQPLLDRPQLSSALGVIDMVLCSEEPYNGVLGKIRRWLTTRR